MRLMVLLIILLFPLSIQAAPDLGTYRDIDGVRVFQDHQDTNTWYLAPARPALGSITDHEPDYGFDIYRYGGRSGTGDRELFWVKGILNMGIERDRDGGSPARIRSVLHDSGISNPRLRSMPVAETMAKLLFADQSREWRQGSRWAGEHLLLLLDRYLAEILWESVTAGQTQVSITLEEHLSGLRREGDEWNESQTVVVSTLPIDLDMEAFPHKFRRTNLGGRMVRGYTGMDIFCFDFLEELDPDLYAKIVEVAIPTPGRDLVEEVTFRPDSEYRTRIDFKLSRDLDEPYRFRVTRILNDGSRDVGPWTAKKGDTLLDVTDYRDLNEPDHIEESVLD
ncbi:MAG: hypothetical protein PHU03_07995 [Syntrophales bacterium]|nr:hypothetical protein [Syntrophales bacterium]